MFRGITPITHEVLRWIAAAAAILQGLMRRIAIAAGCVLGLALGAVPAHAFIQRVEGKAVGAVEGSQFEGPVVSFESDGTQSCLDVRAEWGDGTSTTLTVPAGELVDVNTGARAYSVSGGHTWLREGGFDIKVTISGCGNEPAVANAHAEVVDAAKSSIGLALAAQATVELNGTVARMRDGNATTTPADYSATIDWGDGSESPGALVAAGDGAFDIVGAHVYPTAGDYTVVVRVQDPGGAAITINSLVRVAAAPILGRIEPRRFAIALTRNGRSGLLYLVGRTGRRLQRLRPFSYTPRAGLQLAIGEVTGDRVRDLVVGAGPRSAAGGFAYVKVFSGRSLVRTIPAYGAGFIGNVRVATGDVDGDGVAEIITAPAGAGAAGGHVKVFDGRTGAELLRLPAFPQDFRGVPAVAGGDVDGDGRDEIVVGLPGDLLFGGSVRIYRSDGTIMTELTGFDETYRGGVSVAAADIDGDRVDEVVLAASSRIGAGLPHAKVFSGRSFAVRTIDTRFRLGARVAAGDVDGDGRAEIIAVAASGLPRVRLITPGAGVLDTFIAFRGFRGGVRVG